MKTLFSKWYFWLGIAAGAVIYFSKRQPEAVAPADVFGAGGNARQVSTLPALASYSVVATNTALDPVIQKVQDRLILSTNNAIDQAQDRGTASAELSFLSTTLHNLKAVK